MVSLQPWHTFGLPVKAKNLVKLTALSELNHLWQQAQAAHQPLLFLGQGSNVLFTQDFAGTVIINQLKGIAHRQDPNFHYLHIQAGENWHQLVQWSLQQGIAGLENLALIPGCAGTAPIQNIGAYGVEFERFCDYVDVLDLNHNEIIRLTAKDCQFGYRESIFKHQYAQGYFICAVGLKLAKQWQPVLDYGPLAQLASNSVTAQQIFQQVCHIRQTKLPDPTEFGNAGSFFKNPTVAKSLADTLKQQYPSMPYFPQGNEQVKLAAGWLIDQCQLKGFRLGGAAVHQQQALVLINQDNASSQDVVELARYVHQQVGKQFGIWLQPEVRFIGDTGEIDALELIS